MKVLGVDDEPYLVDLVRGYLESTRALASWSRRICHRPPPQAGQPTNDVA
jgi:hypothetical protein